jgi:nitrogen regulatory protein PII
MSDPSTHPALARMKRIEIVIEGHDLPALRDILRHAGATGYTMIRDVAGLGQGGWHEGRLLFNDDAGLVMVVAVAPDTAVRRIAEGLRVLFAERPGVTFISDVEVLRAERFAPLGA